MKKLILAVAAALTITLGARAENIWLEAMTVSTSPPVVKVPKVTKTVVTSTVVGWRKASGHTHTCESCGETWDHKANDTHTCKQCGGHPPMTANGSYYADAVKKMVPIRQYQTQVVEVVAPLPRQQTTTVATQLNTLQRATVSSNCANGQCATVQTRQTPFRWR